MLSKSTVSESINTQCLPNGEVVTRAEKLDSRQTNFPPDQARVCSRRKNFPPELTFSPTRKFVRSNTHIQTRISIPPPDDLTAYLRDFPPARSSAGINTPGFNFYHPSPPPSPLPAEPTSPRHPHITSSWRSVPGDDIHRVIYRAEGIFAARSARQARGALTKVYVRRRK